ncbi:hypothetical protein, partial [Lacticaseibacillus rhamnosus]|uniref:hypothetical protein n=2 Tax=Lacticaseibacillus rhamnosus TaxID=47715 RepID=UPI000AAF2E7E
VSGLGRDGRALAIATKVLTRKPLRRGARYGERAPTTTPSATVRPQSNDTSILSPKVHLRSS